MKTKTLKLLLPLASASLFYFSFGGEAKAVTFTTIDFEEFQPPPPGGLASFSSTFVSKGFRLSKLPDTNAFLRISDEQPIIPNSGSIALVPNNSSTQAGFTIVKEDGGSFNLISFLGSEGRNTPSVNASERINITGILSGGGTVSSSFELDGFAENDPRDYETFLVAGFTNLSSVVFQGTGGINDGYSFGVDDIQLSTGAVESVPTPAPLMGIVGLGIAALRKKGSRVS